MSYQQLTEGQRYQIFTLLAEGYSQSAIAKRVSVHRSTICRELKRNSDDSRYRPDRANTLSVISHLLPKNLVLVINSFLTGKYILS
ncbi:TPA: helix-turn-helix domain-containing protein [Photobacterium damselae]